VLRTCNPALPPAAPTYNQAAPRLDGGHRPQRARRPVLALRPSDSADDLVGKPPKRGASQVAVMCEVQELDWTRGTPARKNFASEAVIVSLNGEVARGFTSRTTASSPASLRAILLDLHSAQTSIDELAEEQSADLIIAV
jgi:hypothetical protein